MSTAYVTRTYPYVPVWCFSQEHLNHLHSNCPLHAGHNSEQFALVEKRLIGPSRRRKKTRKKR